MKKWLIVSLLIIVVLVIIILIYFNKSNIKEKDNVSNNSNNSNIEKKDENIDNKLEDTNIENKISLNINGKRYLVTLEDNSTTKEFVKLLPLEMTMDDLNKNEKYYYIKEKLPVNSYIPGQIEAGDIMLYGDNCLVIFYKTHSSSYSYTKIGKIDNINEFISNIDSSSINVKIQID